LDKVADQIHEMIQQSPAEVSGVGVGSPGKVDSTRGLVYNAVNLGWTKVNLAEEISNRIEASLPIWIQKDANLSALGEYYFGACQGCTDFVYVGIGSGLGGGIISGGHLITGGDWYAAELGHLSINPDGVLCVCGGHGCAETIVSGAGLVRVTRQLLNNRLHRSILSDRVELSPADVLAAAGEGDALALEAFCEVGRALGIVMASCAAILNPTCIVIGGGLGLAGFDFIEPVIREEMMRRTILNSRNGLDIVRSRLESSAIGSACLVWYALSGKMPNH
jgi:glucokinase